MISTILHYSTLDLPFLKANLEQLSKFSEEIVIPVCTHLFNGEIEDVNKLKQTEEIVSSFFPKAKLHYFNWQGIQLNERYYNTMSRKIGTELCKTKWAFFVDTDEIVDDTFIPWVQEAIKHDRGYWMTSYWYFREPIYQSKKFEAQGLLIRKEKCKWNLEIRNEREEAFNFDNVIHGCNQYILDNNGCPMMHHFSWVRNKEDMLKKVTNWSHKNDRDWISLVEEEFSRPFNGTDFVHGYEYNIVSNKFNIKI